MTDKRLSVAEVLAEIKDGNTVLLGGFGTTRKPMALVRALAASDRKHLTLVTIAGGPDVDLLLATGKVDTLVSSYVGFDQVGLAPHFRLARQNGAIRFLEGSEYTIIVGLEAAANRMPFLPVRSALGSDLLRVNPTYRTFPSPVSDDTLVAIPALNADVAFLHVNYATPAGDGYILGDEFVDSLCARASHRVFLTAEKVLGPGESLPPDPHTRILRLNVAGVVEAPLGAHPTACYPNYTIDYDHLIEYQRLARDAASFGQYLQRNVVQAAEPAVYAGLVRGSTVGGAR